MDYTHIYSYRVLVNTSNYFVDKVIVGIPNPSRNIEHRFFPWISPIPSHTDQKDAGVLVNDFYYPVQYDSNNLWVVDYQLQVVQELIQFNVKEHAEFKSNGLMVSHSYQQHESLLLYPEFLYLISLTSLILVFYYYYSKQIQHEFITRLNSFQVRQRKEENTDNTEVKINPDEKEEGFGDIKRRDEQI